MNLAENDHNAQASNSSMKDSWRKLPFAEAKRPGILRFLMEKKQIKNSGTIDQPSKHCKPETRYRCEYDDEPQEIYKFMHLPISGLHDD